MKVDRRTVIASARPRACRAARATRCSTVTVGADIARSNKDECPKRVDQVDTLVVGAGVVGLAIAREIAESEGGRLTLANRAGGGLDAVIALPVPE